VLGRRGVLGRRRRGPVRRILRAGWNLAVLAAASEPSHVARSFEVVPDWRRLDDEGYAVRLSPTQTFQPTHVTGRWRAVDTNLPYTGWRSSRRATGAGVWALLIALFGWLGWAKGRGPLAELATYRQVDDGSEGAWAGEQQAWGPAPEPWSEPWAEPWAEPAVESRPEPAAEGERLPPLFEGHASEPS
jgi:hypothetical protein